MKILHITPTFFPSVGGIQTVVRELMLNLRRRGFVADAMHISPGNQQRRENLDESVVWRIPLFPNHLLGVIPSVRSILSGYDILHVHDPQLMAVSFNILTQGHGKHIVLSTHGGYRHTSQYGLLKTMHWRFLAPLVLRQYHKVLATSHSDLAQFEAKTTNIMLVPNGVNVEKFLSIDLPAVSDPTQWIYWGRLSRNKRLDILIDTVAWIRDYGLSIDLLIGGKDFDGLLASLTARIDQHGLRNQVRIAGPLSDAELLRELTSRSVFVTASEHEGFGLSIIEAMAAGLIVICRDMPPLNAFVSHGVDGLLLNFDRSPADLSLIERLCESSTNELARMRSNARRAAGAYSWNSAIHRYIDIYQGLMRN